MHDLDLEKIIKIMDNMTNDCCCCCDVLRIRYKKKLEKNEWYVVADEERTRPWRKKISTCSSEKEKLIIHKEPRRTGCGTDTIATYDVIRSL